MTPRQFASEVGRFAKLLKAIRADRIAIVTACLLLVWYGRLRLAKQFATTDMAGKSSMDGVQLACIVHRMSANIGKTHKTIFEDLGATLVRGMVKGVPKWTRLLGAVAEDLIKAPTGTDILPAIAAWFFVYEGLVHSAEQIGEELVSQNVIARIPKKVFEQLQALLKNPMPRP